MSDIQKPENGDATKFLETMGVSEQFFEAIDAYRLENLPEYTRNTETFAGYQLKYADTAIGERLIELLKKIYQEAELQKFKGMDADSIYEYDKSKFKSFEKLIEDFYDEIYLEANRLLSGVQITGTPNQTRPFEFFTVNRPNGLYIVKAFDSYMPQNIQIKQEALIKPAQFLSIEAIDQEIRITLSAPDQELISRHFLTNSDEPLALLLKQRIINIVRDTANLQNNVLLIWSPWPASELYDMTKSVKNEIL
ncbi:hypothetical protein [Sphingobacterium mizutaii]|uniref:hypothetical protein n=1 Tax=Sphingobacterium mizutaii TaxID=1010 RepID=UPI0028B06173|nr:hypothetical protein [Sphingobacterium mizutaii]